MKLARKNDLITEEIYNKKRKITPEDAIFQQVLIYDIARKLRQLLPIALLDSKQLYDRITHAVMVLALYAYRLSKISATSILTLI